MAPAGAGSYKLWNAVGSSDDAKALYAGEMRGQLISLYMRTLIKRLNILKRKV